MKRSKALTEPQTLPKLLETVLEAASDPIGRRSLEKYRGRLQNPPRYPPSPHDFVRPQGTTHPSRQI